MPRPGSSFSAYSDSEMEAEELELADLIEQNKIGKKDEIAKEKENNYLANLELQKQRKEHRDLVTNAGACNSKLLHEWNTKYIQRLCAEGQRNIALVQQLEASNNKRSQEMRKQSLKAENQRREEVLALEHMAKGKKITESIGIFENKRQKALTRLGNAKRYLSPQIEQRQTLENEKDLLQKQTKQFEKDQRGHSKVKSKLLCTASALYEERRKIKAILKKMKGEAEKKLLLCNPEIEKLSTAILNEHSRIELMTQKEEESETRQLSLKEMNELKRMYLGEDSLDDLKFKFEVMQTVTGEDNLDLLITGLIKDDYLNSALYKVVNVQNRDIETRSGQIRHLKSEMEQFREAALQHDQDNAKLLRSLEEQQIEMEYQAEDSEYKEIIQTKLVDQANAKLNHIKFKTEYDCSEIEDHMSTSTGAYIDNNIMSCMGLVEEKTHELNVIEAFLDAKDEDKLQTCPCYKVTTACPLKPLNAERYTKNKYDLTKLKPRLPQRPSSPASPRTSLSDQQGRPLLSSGQGRSPSTSQGE
uniref:ODAD1 central coiled coil region domain-containing protein n=1 Tax=Labrus bergylta TaxID=56723 RepID=A0A3Q3E6E8_9LABR